MNFPRTFHEPYTNLTRTFHEPFMRLLEVEGIDLNSKTKRGPSCTDCMLVVA